MLIFALFLLHVCVAGGRTIISSPPSSSPSSSPSLPLQDAVNMANAGDTIQIAAGLYDHQSCNVSISSKAQISIIGVGGAENTVFDCGYRSRGWIVSGSSSVTIMGIQIRNGINNMNINNLPNNARSSSRRHLPRRPFSTSIKIVIVLTLGEKGITFSHRSPSLPKKKKKKKKNSISSVMPGDSLLIRQSQDIVLSNVVFTGGISSFSVLAMESLGIVIKNQSKIINNNAGGLSLLGCSNIYLSDLLVFNNSITTTSSTATVFGSGLAVQQCNDLVISTATFNKNWIFCSSDASGNSIQVFGAGMGITSGFNVRISSSVDLSENSIIISQDGANGIVFGAGFGAINCQNIQFFGAITVNNNVISSTTATNSLNLEGGGVSIQSSTFITFSSAAISISNNSLNTRGSGYLQGGGAHFYQSSNVWIQGPLMCVGNRLIASSNSQWLAGAGLYFENCMNITMGREMIVISQNMQLFQDAVLGYAGGGMYWYQCSNIMISGQLSVVNNSLVALGRGSLYGGGIYIETCASIVVSASLLVSDNSILLYGSTSRLCGCGLYIVTSSDIHLTAPSIQISNNLIFATKPTAKFDFGETAYLPPPLTNDTQHCPVYLTIPNAFGTINDGSYGKYSNGIVCSWALSPSDRHQALDVFKIQFNYMNTEKGYDSLFIYDGPTTAAPVIGKYSGSISNYVCITGICPPLSSPIFSSTGQILITFSSDASGNYNNGFQFNWTMVAANRTFSILLTKFLDDSAYYPSSGVGAGLGVSSSQLNISNALFMENKIFHPFLAIGAGCQLKSVGTNIQMDNVTFIANMAFGTHSGGGALAQFSSATTTCSHCRFYNNSAFGYGDVCFYSAVAAGVLCNMALGGGVMVSSGSIIRAENPVFFGNRATCSSKIQCTTQGGSMAIIHPQTQLIFNRLLCSSTTLGCDPVNCPWAAGGCVFVDSAIVVISNSTLNSNSASGVGNGGAIFCLGDANLFLSSVFIVNNTARQGGALTLTSTSFSQILNCSFWNNIANSVAGALALRDDASLTINDSNFFGNSATRAAVLFSFSDSNIAEYNGERNYFQIDPGSGALILGHFRFTGSNVWNCTWQGTIFSQDFSDQFFSLTCMQCTPGTYSPFAASTLIPEAVTCLKCPYGATCAGSSPSSNGLLAISGFWGSLNSNGSARFYPCPAGYCCPVSSGECEYNHCEGNRVGKLCGSCPENQGLRFFSDGCGPDSDCKDTVNWAVPVVIVCGVSIATFLTITTGRKSNGKLSVLLYFYQALPFVKSTAWKSSSPKLVGIVQSIFAFSPTSVGSQTSGVCALPSMNAKQKLLMRLLMLGVAFLALIFVYIVHYLVSFILPQRQLRKKLLKHPCVARYLATAVRLLTISYTTLVLVPLELLHCVFIDGDYVWFLDASVGCFTSWQIWAFVAILLLFPIPMTIILLLKIKWKNAASVENSEWKMKTYKVFTAAYHPEQRWWLGWSLYRRFLLALAATMITDANWKSIAVTFLCTCFLVISVLIQPFHSKLVNQGEIASLLCLAVLAVTEAPNLSQIQYGASDNIWKQMYLEWVQFSIAAWPLLAYCVSSINVGLVEILKWFVGRKREIIDDDTMMSCEMCSNNQECEEHQYC